VASGTYLACYFAGGLVGSAVLGQLFDRLGWTSCVVGIGIALASGALLTVRLTLRRTNVVIMSLDTIIFRQRSELIAAADVALPARSKLLTTLIARLSDLLAQYPNLRRARSRSVRMGLCAVSLGVKVQIQKQSAIWALHSTEFQNGSRWLLP